MPNPNINKERGARLDQAMVRRGQRKAMALAAELKLSPAAISKWRQGHAMSVENACRLSVLLDVSLDWLLMGRAEPGPTPTHELKDLELDLVDKLRRRPTRIGKLLLGLITEIPERSEVD